MNSLPDAVVAFHGHLCPGLVLGIRAAQIALRELGPRAADEELVAAVETDMCAVDAIQFLTGCTFGKGNLIHLDYGKNAFRFWRRVDGTGIRIVCRPDAFRRDPEYQALREQAGSAAAAGDRARVEALRAARALRVLEAPEDELFIITPLVEPVPARARLHDSHPCADCGEAVMETRVRMFGGRILCIPCFERRDRRW